MNKRLKSLSERLKIWLIHKSLAYHESEAVRCREWLLDRQMKSVESYEEKAGMSGYIPGLRGEKNV
jgi:hypothetical protein